MNEPATNEQQSTMERLHAMEAELVAVQRELEHTHRLTTIGTLTAGIAHEINNLLTPALAYAQLAEARPDDLALLRKAVRKAAAGIEASSRILRTVLDFSGTDEGADSAHVDAALQAALDCLGRDLGGRIHLIREVEPDLVVAMGPLPLQQTLLNLLLNACNALSDRGGQVTVTAAGRDDGRSVIAIADNGPGIPPEIAETIFEPFVSLALDEEEADPEGRGRRRGTGLGLAICRRAVEAAGGTIEAAPTPGGGATFVVELPLVDPVSA